MANTLQRGTPLPEKGDVLPTGPHKPAMLAAVGRLLDFINGKPLDARLEAELNEHYGASTPAYAELLTLLRTGIAEGWACYAEIDGPDYRRGRIAKPSSETHGFSVESGMLKDVLGNYHRHPRGEINMIGPVDETGRFCGHGAGWKVFEPDSRHYPTVTGGKVTMLFFLPNGEIEYMEPPR
jgi:2-hydroxylaminobenzoate mutase